MNTTAALYSQLSGRAVGDALAAIAEHERHTSDEMHVEADHLLKNNDDDVLVREHFNELLQMSIALEERRIRDDEMYGLFRAPETLMSGEPGVTQLDLYLKNVYREITTKLNPWVRECLHVKDQVVWHDMLVYMETIIARDDVTTKIGLFISMLKNNPLFADWFIRTETNGTRHPPRCKRITEEQYAYFLRVVIPQQFSAVHLNRADVRDAIGYIQHWYISAVA